MSRILLVEDDVRLADLIADFLTTNDFTVDVLHRGDLVVDTVKKNAPALIILDIMLPQVDGFTLMTQLRTFYNKPIFFFTAKDSDFDHVKGLEIGADDYLIKPIEPHVLLARINTALRRTSALQFTKQQTLTYGQLTIDKSTRCVCLDNQDIELTSHEFELLWLLASKPGEIQSREVIHHQMIGREYDGLDRSVDVRVSRLRKKLNDDLKKPTRILTVWGKGYIFSPSAWN